MTAYVLGNSWQMLQIPDDHRKRLDAEPWVFACNLFVLHWKVLGIRPTVWVFGDQHSPEAVKLFGNVLEEVGRDARLKERLKRIFVSVEHYPDQTKKTALANPELSSKVTFYKRSYEPDSVPAKTLDEPIYHFASTITDLVNFAAILVPDHEIKVCGCQHGTRWGYFYEDGSLPPTVSPLVMQRLKAHRQDGWESVHLAPAREAFALFTENIWRGLVRLRQSGINVFDANYAHAADMPAELRLPRCRLF